MSEPEERQPAGRVGMAAEPSAQRGFTLTTPAVLSRAAVDRDETLRTDVERQRSGWASARLVVVDPDGRTPIAWEDAPTSGFDVGDAGSWDRGGSARLATRPATGDAPAEGAVLLGEREGVASSEEGRVGKEC